MRKETLQEWFFKIEVCENTFVPAPSEAIEKRDALRLNWLQNHPRLDHEIPVVSLGPVFKNKKLLGYSVRTEIFYR